MCTNCIHSMVMMSLRLQFSMWLGFPLVLSLGLLQDLLQIFGGEGDINICFLYRLFDILRKMALAFTVIYAFSALTKLSSNFWWLMAGRILGGISTSILFSTFESWYVYEHSERHRFPTEWIGMTFSITTFWNGIMAIIAGLIISN